jgi:hypothetical protein
MNSRSKPKRLGILLRLATRLRSGIQSELSGRTGTSPGELCILAAGDQSHRSRTDGSPGRVVPVAAHYVRKTGRIVVELSSKVIVSFSPGDVEGLEDAKPSQLSAIEISPSGFGIHFPAVDADLSVPGILEGFLGSKKWMAANPGAGLRRRPLGQMEGY